MQNDLSGRRFTRLVALRSELVQTRSKKQTMWLCVCDCGKQKYVMSSFLFSGAVKSCGCARNERIASLNRSHGKSRGGGAYKSWQSMIQRCNNPNSPMYYAYGGRGITVCERWTSFEAFIEDLGERPKGGSLERIDPNGNYEPQNCKWLPMELQAKNKTTNRHVLVNGERMIQADAARLLGVGPQALGKWRWRGIPKRFAGVVEFV